MKTRQFYNRHHQLRLIVLGSAIITALPTLADVRMPKFFTDDMMLQRDLPIRVWGWAEVGEQVGVSLAGKTASSKADAQGAWKVELPAIKAGENLELTVKGKNTVTLKNLIIGDIWVCSGQSNMEMSLGGCLDSAEDIKTADLPKIRRIKFNHAQTGDLQADAPAATPWQVCSPATVPQFTAVGFYFAREILAKTGVPIGIVDSNWGGTKIEPWVAEEGLGLVDSLKPELTARQEAHKAYQAQLPAALNAMESWIAQTRKNFAAGLPTTAPPAISGLSPNKGAYSGMYNAMIHPIIQAHIKGAIWYQGESNGEEGQSYHDKMQALIGGWRKQWGQGDFPFYFVQLASFQKPNEEPAGGNGWAKLREAQLKSLSIPNTGMAVITDTVPLAQAGDIHPKNKYDVGTRLALWALAKDYGKKEVVCSGPLFKAMKIDGSKVLIAFDHLGSGLMMARKEGRAAPVETKEGKLQRFAIAGADKKWFWADAVIEKNLVVVSSPEVKEPVAVRFGYEMNPDGANLYNREGIPASPFRTDSW